jgi:hypothetical protein
MRSYRRKQKRNKRTRRRGRKTQRGGEEKCLFVSFPPDSGLGNLLWAYAAAVDIKMKNGSQLCLLPYTNKHSGNDYRKILFKQGRSVETEEAKGRLGSAKRLLGDMKLVSTESHKEWKYTPAGENSGRNTVVGDAYFQNYKSIEAAIPTIRKDCAEVFAERYPGFKDTIKPTSAFMHVRKGDYKEELSLNNDYYMRGLSMLDGVPDITDIYIVSDDIAWCKQQGWASTKLQWFDDPEDSKDELKTMYLMSLCLAGACISASTFSSWGAMLGADGNEASTIIYPSSWITGRQSSELMFPSRWKNIEGIQNVFTK